jgi:hypothetical protein
MHQKNALDPEALFDPFADLESNADEVKTSAVSESSTEQPAAAADLEGGEASGESGEGDTDDDFEEPTRPRG